MSAINLRIAIYLNNIKCGYVCTHLSHIINIKVMRLYSVKKKNICNIFIKRNHVVKMNNATSAPLYTVFIMKLYNYKFDDI